MRADTSTTTSTASLPNISEGKKNGKGKGSLVNSVFPPDECCSFDVEEGLRDIIQRGNGGGFPPV